MLHFGTEPRYILHILHALSPYTVQNMNNPETHPAIMEECMTDGWAGPVPVFYNSAIVKWGISFD